MSEKPAHTPGPWQVQDPMGDGQGDALWIVQEGATPQAYDWRCVAIVTSDDPDDLDCSTSDPISQAERDANARLIAAAPELLDALKALAEEAHRNMAGGAGHLLDDAWAAIAKAARKVSA